MRRRLLWGVLAALLAAACGDDGGTASSTSTTSSTSVTSSTTVAAALTDSFRGVSATTIQVGFTSIDFDRLNAIPTLDLPYASFTPPMERMVEALNERGGINGRMIELHVRPFLPVGPTEAEQICVDLTQDVGVFAVLFGFSGPGATEVNECFTVLNDTVLVGIGGSQEQLARATAPWISNSMNRERRAQGLVDILDDNDRLTELGDVAIIASTADDAPVVEALRKAFADKGTRVVFDASVMSTNDQAATSDEIDVLAEKGRTEGVNTFVFLGDDAFANQQLIRSGEEFNLVWLNSDVVGHWRSDPPPGIEDAKLILATGSGPSSADDPEWGDCVQLAEEAYGAPLVVGADRNADETDYWTGMVNACLTLRLFELVAAAAGPDLTNDSFAAAVDDFGSYTMPGTPFASLGPGKYDGSDTLRLTAWDADEGEWQVISEPYDVTP